MKQPKKEDKQINKLKKDLKFINKKYNEDHKYDYLRERW